MSRNLQTVPGIFVDNAKAPVWVGSCGGEWDVTCWAWAAMKALGEEETLHQRAGEWLGHEVVWNQLVSNCLETSVVWCCVFGFSNPSKQFLLEPWVFSLIFAVHKKSRHVKPTYCSPIILQSGHVRAIKRYFPNQYPWHDKPLPPKWQGWWWGGGGGRRRRGQRRYRW